MGTRKLSIQLDLQNCLFSTFFAFSGDDGELAFPLEAYLVVDGVLLPVHLLLLHLQLNVLEPGLGPLHARHRVTRLLLINVNFSE
jgi:hypothetical protein